MNDKKDYAQIALYNFINSFLFFYVSVFSTFEIFINTEMSLQIVHVVFCALISGVVFFITIAKNRSISPNLQLVFINVLLFAFFTTLIFILYSLFKSYLPIAELNSAYGLWIMFLCGVYLFISLTLKIGVFIYSAVHIFQSSKTDKKQ